MSETRKRRNLRIYLSDEFKKDAELWKLDDEIRKKSASIKLQKLDVSYLHLNESLLSANALLEQKEPCPPSSWLIESLLPADMSEDFLANLEELYTSRWVPKYGERRAQWIWRAQCWQMVVRKWLGPLFNAIERVNKTAGS